METVTHNELCEKAGKWLKRHNENIVVPNCNTIAVDMASNSNETPDIIGWSSCFSVMIEVKVSRGDFLNDKKKIFRQHPETGVGQLRFYCCPQGLISVDELPDNWGLLYLNKKCKIELIKVAEMQKCDMKKERTMLLSIIRRSKSPITKG